MRTFAAHAADQERSRYNERKKHDATTEAGAKAILADPIARPLAQQSILALDEGPLQLSGLPASASVMMSLETLGMVRSEVSKVMATKIVTYSLTPQGKKMATSAKAAIAKAALEKRNRR